MRDQGQSIDVHASSRSSNQQSSLWKHPLYHTPSNADALTLPSTPQQHNNYRCVVASILTRSAHHISYSQR